MGADPVDQLVDAGCCPAATDVGLRARRGPIRRRRGRRRWSVEVSCPGPRRPRTSAYAAGSPLRDLEVEVVGAVPAEEPVVAEAAPQRVVAVAAEDGVVAGAAVGEVAAAAQAKDVVPARRRGPRPGRRSGGPRDPRVRGRGCRTGRCLADPVAVRRVTVRGARIAAGTSLTVARSPSRASLPGPPSSRSPVPERRRSVVELAVEDVVVLRRRTARRIPTSPPAAMSAIATSGIGASAGGRVIRPLSPSTVSSPPPPSIVSTPSSTPAAEASVRPAMSATRRPPVPP